MVKKKIPDRNKTIFNASEACGYMGVCWNTLKKLINEGEIRAVRVGRKYLIPKDAIDSYINRDTLIAEILVKTIKT